MPLPSLTPLDITDPIWIPVGLAVGLVVATAIAVLVYGRGSTSYRRDLY